MRIGFMTHFDPERVKFARENGFGSVELVTPIGTDYLPGNDGWKDKASQVKAAFDEAGIRISCIGGFYVNHMDPANAEQFKRHTRAVIDLAEFMGVPVVAGFAGRLVDQDLEASIPKFKEIWSEHAKYAADRGIKIAFEHCPMGRHHLPPGGINCMCTPAMWEKCFDAAGADNLGLEWDPSHLVCMFIDPVENLEQFGSRVFHVHAKDAKVRWHLLRRYGIYHPGVIEHCFPGLGDTDWAAVIKELRRQGYHGDLNIEGRHDSVFRDPRPDRGKDPAGPKLEDLGLLIGLRHLSQFVDGV